MDTLHSQDNYNEFPYPLQNLTLSLFCAQQMSVVSLNFLETLTVTEGQLRNTNLSRSYDSHDKNCPWKCSNPPLPTIHIPENFITYTFVKS